jgi:glycosyltransferase involved in cell wall biosynthesis
MNTQPTILVIASTYPRWLNDPEPGFVHELNRRLAKNYSVHVISPHAAGAKAEECIDNVRIHRFRYAPEFMETLVSNGGILANLKQNKFKWLMLPFFFIGMQIKILKVVLKIKPACIHVHWIIPQGLCLAFVGLFIKLPPVLLTSHGGDLFSLKGSFFALLKSWVLSKAASMTVVSNLMVAEVVKLGVTREKIAVIPMGVDFNGRFTPGKLMPRNENELLFVGRLVEKKGVSLLIKALAKAAEKIPSIRLIVAGYGPELADLKQLAQTLAIEDRVEFLGAVKQTDLVKLYRQCTVFVAPFIEAKSGDQEGFPVSIIEAIACETPLLTSNLPVLVDAFGDFAAQLTSNVMNVNEFSEKIINTVENSFDNASAVMLLRNKFIADLDWVEIARRYETSIGKLID